uniref:Type II toxin-antitoxin system RelE/ParE family toxin n=1 Tax=uncultured Desulfobacterium sp. TaxID=201089 RepID=E1YI12_9BACT|nr:hypothetical protein N47_D30900 [uncultured Desulfobacterium sp.]
MEYYEEQRAGLGLRLKEEIDQHAKWITRNSDIPRIRKGGYRRVNIKVFPCYIVYIIHENILWILAIANSHKKPEYWIKRKDEVS